MNALALLAQAGLAGTVGYYAMIIIAVIVVVAILYAFASYAGFAPPPIAVKIFWIAVCGLGAILLIKLFLTFI